MCNPRILNLDYFIFILFENFLIFIQAKKSPELTGLKSILKGWEPIRSGNVFIG